MHVNNCLLADSYKSTLSFCVKPHMHSNQICTLNQNPSQRKCLLVKAQAKKSKTIVDCSNSSQFRPNFKRSLTKLQIPQSISPKAIAKIQFSDESKLRTASLKKMANEFPIRKVFHLKKVKPRQESINNLIPPVMQNNNYVVSKLKLCRFQAKYRSLSNYSFLACKLDRTVPESILIQSRSIDY